jgi:carbonic anhydrase
VHYPAEHLFNSTRYDLEIQLVHTDLLGRYRFCMNGGFLSLFFSLTEGTLETNGFFDFTDPAKGVDTVDLQKLLGFGAAQKSFVSGYMGTDSMPPCDSRTCWYLYEEPFKITQE